MPGLSVPAAPQPPKPAHSGRAEADPGHAPQKLHFGHGRAVAPAAAAGLHPPAGESVPGHAQVRPVPAGREETSLQAKAL